MIFWSETPGGNGEHSLTTPAKLHFLFSQDQQHGSITTALSENPTLHFSLVALKENERTAEDHYFHIPACTDSHHVVYLYSANNSTSTITLIATYYILLFLIFYNSSGSRKEDIFYSTTDHPMHATCYPEIEYCTGSVPGLFGYGSNPSQKVCETSSPTSNSPLWAE